MSDQAQVAAFDAVFFSVFGDAGRAPTRVDARHAPTVAAPPDDRPTPTARPPPASRARDVARRRRGDDDEDGAEVDVPLAMASDEEVLAGKSFDALEPHELAQLYRLMARLRARHPAAAHAPPRARPPRPADRHAADAAREPAHRRRADPPGAPAPARSRRAGS